MASLHVGEYGAKLLVTVGRTLASNTALQLLVTKPDGTSATWMCNVEGAEADGVMSYTLVSGDLDQEGIYRLHSHVTYSGQDFIGDQATITVKNKFRL